MKYWLHHAQGFFSIAAKQVPWKQQKTQQYHPNTNNYLDKLQMLPQACGKIAK